VSHITLLRAIFLQLAVKSGGIYQSTKVSGSEGRMYAVRYLGGSVFD